MNMGNLTKKMKKIILTCMITVFLTLVVGGELLAKAADMDSGGLDVVIVVDTSGSMKQTDSERLAVEAAKLFVDMMETAGSKVALVPFSHELGNVIPMTEIHSQSDKYVIKDALDGIRYTGDTDIGLALKAANEILAQDINSENRRVILFFTDGKIDLPKGSRTNEDSKADALDVANVAAEEEIPIYTIGLNSNGNVDQELISDLSAATGGRNYIVDNAEVLPQIFDEIYADFINSNIISLGDFVTDGVNFVEIPFSIENNSVLEANIIMLSDKALDEIQVIDPNGENVMADSTHMIVEESDRYTLLKLITPGMGEWKLMVKGDDGCKVHVNLIFNYRVSLQCEAEVVFGETGPNIEVLAWMDKDGSKLTDKDLYQAFVGKVYLESESGSQVFDMVTHEDSFSTSIPADDLYGEFTLFARIESESMYRESEPVALSILNSAPIISGIPSELEFKGTIATFGKEKFIIADHITDPEGDSFEVTVETDENGKDIMSSKVSGKKIILAPKGNGETVVVIRAIDANGAESVYKINVTTDFKMQSIWVLLLLILLGIVLVVALLILLSKVVQSSKVKNAPFYGVIQWMPMSGQGGQQMHRLDYDRGYLSLSAFILNPEASEMDLKKVVIHMNKTGDGIQIENKSRKCTMVAGYGSSNSKKVEIRSGEFVLLNGKFLGADVAIKVTYIM